MNSSNLASVSKRFYQITQSYLQTKEPSNEIIKETQDAIRLTRKLLLMEIFPRWSPFNGEISFSYNGGKDCQVLLILYLGCLWEWYTRDGVDDYQSFPLKTLKAVFIDQDKNFTTLEEFVEFTKKRYSLSLYESNGKSAKKVSMAEAFRQYLDDQSETKAIVVGIRYSDPFAHTFEPIQKTDSGWPDFLRLQPLLHWKLVNVWSFLIYSGEPICGIYGAGFTSLGDINHTLPNPCLNKRKLDDREYPLRFQWELDHGYSDGNTVNCTPLSVQDSHLQNDQYFPGWYLLDDSLERAGRNKMNEKT